MLAAAERSLALLRDSKSPHVASMREEIATAEDRVASSLGEELERRSARGWICGDAPSPDALERYLERASRLKKHFQEVLFLEPETFHVAERLHHWVAAFAALVASTWAFAWQMFLAHRTPTTEARLGSGLVLVLIAGGSSTRRRTASRRSGAPGSAATCTASTPSASRATARRRGGSPRGTSSWRRASRLASADVPSDPLNPRPGRASPRRRSATRTAGPCSRARSSGARGYGA